MSIFGALTRLLGFAQEPAAVAVAAGHPNPGCAVVPAPMSSEDWIAKAERKNALMNKYGVRNLAEAAELERQHKKRQKAE